MHHEGQDTQCVTGRSWIRWDAPPPVPVLSAPAPEPVAESPSLLGPPGLPRRQEPVAASSLLLGPQRLPGRKHSVIDSRIEDSILTIRFKSSESNPPESCKTDGGWETSSQNFSEALAGTILHIILQRLRI